MFTITKKLSKTVKCLKPEYPKYQTFFLLIIITQNTLDIKHLILIFKFPCVIMAKIPSVYWSLGIKKIVCFVLDRFHCPTISIPNIHCMRSHPPNKHHCMRFPPLFTKEIISVNVSSVLSEHLSIPNTKADFKEVHFRQDSLYQTPSPFFSKEIISVCVSSDNPSNIQEFYCQLYL